MRGVAAVYPGADLRVSDAERERCAGTLRDACAAGRISVAELDERLDRAYRARTRRDLRVLTADLPRDVRRRVAACADRVDRVVLRAHAVTFTAVNSAMVGLWGATGGGDFWPAWLLVPWGMTLGWHAGGSWSVRRLLRGSRSGSPSRRRLA